MSKQTQGTMLMVGALAGTVGLVAFVALLVLGEYAFSPALFLAIIVAGAAAVFLMVGFHRKPAAPMVRQAHAPTPHAAPQAAPVAAAPASAPQPTPAAPAAPAPAPAPAAPATAATSVSNDQEAGTRPAALEGPREGGADDLKRIKGIGPKLEDLCHTLGFYHFDQIANWSADEVAWVDENLEGFKGRVSRDNWVDQARLLSAGGETEFSRKMDDGTVY